MTPRYSYNGLKAALQDALHDLSILSGHTCKPPDVSLQDVAGTCAVNFRHVATLIDAARAGRTDEWAILFPGPEDLD